MLIDTSFKVFSSQALLARFRGVAAVVGPHVFAGVLSSSRSLPHASFAVAPEGPLVLHGGQPSSSDVCHSSMWRWFVGGTKRTGGYSVSLSRFLLHPCCCIPTNLSDWGAHLLDMTASEVWSQEESSLHISVLEMKAVSLALAAFLPQLSSQSVILMSDNALVSFISGIKASQCLVSHGHRGSPLDRVAFGLPDGQIYYGEKEHSGGPAQSSQPGFSRGFARCSGVLIAPSLPPTLMPSFLYTSLVLNPMAWKQDVFQHIGTICQPMPSLPLLCSGSCCREFCFRPGWYRLGTLQLHPSKFFCVLSKMQAFLRMLHES